MNVYLGLFLSQTLVFSLLAASQYAQKCERVIGVKVPVVDCSDPNGSEVPVGRVEGNRCEVPSHGLSECNPGTKFIRFDDTFTRDGKTEKVTTMIMCRKTSLDIARGNTLPSTYSDIGIIQYNETKNATCWFSKTNNEDPLLPTIQTGSGRNRRMAYPSPSSVDENFWGNGQPNAQCLECHQSGVWLRSPFAKGVRAEQGKGYKRTERAENGYQPGDGNSIPDNNEITAQRGLSCSVGKPTWNSGPRAPFQIKINNEAAIRRFGAPVGRQASLNACTQCHYIGAEIADLVIEDTSYEATNMSCKTFLVELTTTEKPNRLGSVGPSHFWMPPSPAVAASTSRERYRQEFGKAIEVVQWCCNRANSREPDYNAICGEKFSTGREDRENRNRLNADGPCALCSTRNQANDCDEPPAEPRAVKGGTSTNRRTH